MLSVEGPASLTKNHAPCLVLVHFAASTYTDESILRIHSHLECSRVKFFITLYDMSPRIMGLLRPLLQLLLTGQAFVPLLPNSEFFPVYSICLKQTLMESYGWKIIIAVKTCESF